MPRVRLAAGSVDEGNNAATDVVAYSVPTFFIEPIADQNIVFGTDWNLNINISGDPDDAYIIGELHSFGWDYSNGVISIIGTPDALVSNKPFTVYAVKNSVVIQRSAIYNVIPSAPVIESFGPWTFVEGSIFRKNVLIRNAPSMISVAGHWFFLDSENIQGGVLITGDIPTGINLSVDEGDITIEASNLSGSDSGSGVILIRSSGPATVPTNISIAGLLSAVRISFEPPEHNGNLQITNYAYRYKTTGSYTEWFRTIGVVDNITIPNLDPSTQYTFQIAAENAFGIGDPSEELQVATSNRLNFYAISYFMINTDTHSINKYNTITGNRDFQSDIPNNSTQSYRRGNYFI